MSGDKYQITASGNSFVNVGDSYYTGDQKTVALRNFLLPEWQSNKSLGLYWDHEQARQKHVGRTGKWLYDSDEFKSWLLEPSSFLWLHGIAGCGKTVLSSTIIDYLQAPSRGSNRTAGYFFNASEDEKRNVSRLIRSLLLQLCPPKGDLSPKLEELYKKCISQEVSNDHLFGGLKELIENAGQTYIVIDAMDECDRSFRSGKDSEAQKLANFILWLTGLKSPRLHLLVTSRDGALPRFVEKELSNIVQQGTENDLYRQKVDLAAKKMKDKIDNDIKEFIELELGRWNTHLGRLWLPLNTARQKLVADSIQGRANGMFLLAACLLDLLWRKSSWEELEPALNDLPPELPKLYDRIFDDIKKEGRMETASSLLRWLLYSERPLSLDELIEVTMTDSQGATFSLGRGAKDGSYVSLTLSSFVAISKDNLVQFAHQTVKEYLLLDTTEDGLFSRKADSQAFIAKCCLSYMQFCGQSDLKCRYRHGASKRCPKEYILLEYAFNNWYRHALEVWKGTTNEFASAESVPALEVKASQEVNDRGNAQTSNRSLATMGADSESQTTPQSLFEWAASVKLWLNQITPIERIPDRATRIALACKGYEKFAELLLVTTTPPTFQRKNMKPRALLAAALSGNYREMTQLVLEGTANRNQIDSSWWPETRDLKEVCILAFSSHDVIVNLLLNHGWDINLGMRTNGWTALHITAFQGHERITNLLLEKGADIDSRDCDGRTALHIASSQGHDVVTQLLLEKGAGFGARDKVGWTALDFAVQKIVMGFKFQDRQVEPDYSGRRTAWQAVHSNHETATRTIRLLLERKPELEEDCDIEARGLTFEGSSTFLRSSMIENVVVDGGTARVVASVAKRIESRGGATSYIVPFVKELNISGGRVRFGMSIIEELLVHGQLVTFTRTAPVGMLQRYRWPIASSTTRFETVLVYGGTANLRASYIKELKVYGGSTTSSAAVQISEATIYNGSVDFSTTAQADDVVVHGGSVVFSTTAQIRDLTVYGGSVVFSGTAEIRDLTVYGGSAHFLGRSQIADVTAYRGSTNFAALTTNSLTTYEGSVNFLSTAQIKEVVVYGGMVDFIYGVYREMMELLIGQEVDFVWERDRGSGMVQIEYVVIYGGSFHFWTSGRIKDLTTYEGIANLATATALQHAIRCGYDDMARLLLEKGADPNATCWPQSEPSSSGWTALHEAAYQGNEAIVQLLVKKKADAKIKDTDGNTALQLAKDKGHAAIVQFLEGNELGVDKKGEMGQENITILQKAAEGIYRAIFRSSR